MSYLFSDSNFDSYDRLYFSEDFFDTYDNSDVTFATLSPIDFVHHSIDLLDGLLISVITSCDYYLYQCSFSYTSGLILASFLGMLSSQ